MVGSGPVLGGGEGVGLGAGRGGAGLHTYRLGLPESSLRPSHLSDALFLFQVPAHPASRGPFRFGRRGRAADLEAPFASGWGPFPGRLARRARGGAGASWCSVQWGRLLFLPVSGYRFPDQLPEFRPGSFI